VAFLHLNHSVEAMRRKFRLVSKQPRGVCTIVPFPEERMVCANCFVFLVDGHECVRANVVTTSLFGARAGLDCDTAMR
jgi:hypothetical protein